MSTMTTKKIFFFFSVFLHTNLTHRGVRHRRQKREEEKKEETRHFSPWAPSSIHFEEKLCVEDDGGASFWQSPPSLSFSSLLSLFYFIISLVDVVGVHTIKASALLHFPLSSPCCNWREPISFLLSSCRRCLLGIESSLFPLE